MELFLKVNVMFERIICNYSEWKMGTIIYATTAGEVYQLLLQKMQ